ncbi:MAG: 4Fe-4S binding protein, partial [Candidatus Bathyarchaeia archaeon]
VMEWPPRPDVVFDSDKCGNPTTCLKCMLACPYRLIGLIQTEPPPPGSSEGPKNFELISTFRVLCTACRFCEEACPKGAIKVILPQHFQQ